VRPDQNAGDDVTQHDRLAQQVEDDRDDAGRQHDDGQIMNEFNDVHSAGA